MIKLEKEKIDRILDKWNINQPRGTTETKKRIRQFKKLAKTNFKPVRTFKSGKLKGCTIGYLGSRKLLRSQNGNYISM